MGLDMYLEERRYIGAQYDHNKITGSIDLAEDGTPIDIDLRRVKEITLDAGYWRKANAIHKWFVDNVQDGVDECQSSYVSFEQLKELKDLCNLILTAEGKERESLIIKLLPPTEGFFFGNTSLDTPEGMEWYLQDLTDTVAIIDKLEEGKASFYYQSSW